MIPTTPRYHFLVIKKAKLISFEQPLGNTVCGKSVFASAYV